MKNKIMTGALSIMLITIFIATAFSAGLPQHFQGAVMENNGTYLIVAEKKVLIKGDTYVMNSKEEKISLSDIKPGNHVYVKAELDENDNIVAKKIYLLPRRISHKEFDKYPFMKEHVKIED